MKMISVTFDCGHRWIMTKTWRPSVECCKECGCRSVREEFDIHVSIPGHPCESEADASRSIPISDVPVRDGRSNARRVDALLASMGFRVTMKPGPHDSRPGGRNGPAG
jgi:hypothetical protein